MNWKGLFLESAAHVALPLCSLWALLAIALGGSRALRLARAVGKRPIVAWAFLWAVPFLILYIGLGFQGSGDHDLWIQQHVAPIRAGLMPGRDVESFYSPLFPYVQFAGAATLNFAVAGSLIPFVAAGLLLGGSASALGRRVVGTGAAATFATWVLVDPSLWYSTLLLGQDEVLFAAMLLLAAALVANDRLVLAGGIAGLGLAATKITFLPYAGALLVAAAEDRRSALRVCGGFAAAVSLVYGSFGLAGHSILPTAALASRARDSLGHSISISQFLPTGPQAVTAQYAVTGVVGLGAVLATRWRSRARGPALRVVLCVAAGHAALALTMPYHLPTYVAQGAPFVVLAGMSAAGPRRGRWILLGAALLSFLVSIWRGSPGPAWYFPLVSTVSITFHGAILGWLLLGSQECSESKMST